MADFPKVTVIPDQMRSLEPIKELTALLGKRDMAEVIRLSKRMDRIESHWRNVFEMEVYTATTALLDNTLRSRRLKFETVDFLPMLMRMSYEVSLAGFQSTAIGGRVPRAPALPVRLAKGRVPKSAMPKTLAELRRWWDTYRRTGRGVPERQRVLAEKLKDAYIDGIQKVWKSAAEGFLAGRVGDQAEPVIAIREAARVTASRAKMTAATETTYYYNEARRSVYDRSDDVTHYLFVAIRDHRTTKWCNTRQGLVYKKTDPLLDKETPPIHWNCRSELLPLTPKNPSHLALIHDAARQRRSNSPAALPPDWTGRRRSG